MKYKIGDKVRITRVDEQTDPKMNDWVGKVSKVKGVKPEEWSKGYMLENGFPAYEGELELVPEFKVGDIVVIAHAEGNDSSLRPNDTGVVLRIAEYETEHPYEVKFLDGEAILYMGKELELVLPEPEPKFRVGDRVRVTTTANPDYTRGKVGYIREIWDKDIFFPFKVKLDNWKHNSEGWDYGYSDTEIEKVEPVFTSGLLDKIMNSSIWFDFGSVAPQPKQEAKPRATTTFALLGKDGFYYDAEFVNVGYELFRSYLFPAENIPDGRVKQASIIRIDNPRWLYVAPSGSHRIIDKYGRSHYIPCGWKHLWWLVEEGKPEPVK